MADDIPIQAVADEIKKLARDYLIFSNFLLCVLGLVTWEVIITIRYDIKMILNWKKLKLPVISYLLSRYCMIISISLSIVYTHLDDPSTDCQTILHVLTAFGQISVIATSSIFVIRALALAGWRDFFSIALLMTWIAQAGLTLSNVTSLKGGFVLGVCTVTGAEERSSSGFWATLGVDLFAFFLIAKTLLKRIKIEDDVNSSRNSSPLLSKVAKILLRDGVIYLICAISFQLVAAILVQSKLNPLMRLLPTPLAVVFPSIVACRAFQSLGKRVNSNNNGNESSLGRSSERQSSSFPHNFKLVSTPRPYQAHLRPPPLPLHSDQFVINGQDCQISHRSSSENDQESKLKDEKEGASSSSSSPSFGINYQSTGRLEERRENVVDS